MIRVDLGESRKKKEDKIREGGGGTYLLIGPNSTRIKFQAGANKLMGPEAKKCRNAGTDLRPEGQGDEGKRKRLDKS